MTRPRSPWDRRHPGEAGAAPLPEPTGAGLRARVHAPHTLARRCSARLHADEDNSEDDDDDEQYQDHQHLPVLLLILLCLVELFQAVFSFDTGLLNIIVDSIKDGTLGDK